MSLAKANLNSLGLFLDPSFHIKFVRNEIIDLTIALISWKRTLPNNHLQQTYNRVQKNIGKIAQIKKKL